MVKWLGKSVLQRGWGEGGKADWKPRVTVQFCKQFHCLGGPSNDQILSVNSEADVLPKNPVTIADRENPQMLTYYISCAYLMFNWGTMFVLISSFL